MIALAVVLAATTISSVPGSSPCQEIDTSLFERGERRARIWRNTWVGLHSASVAARGALALSANDGRDRASAWVAAVPNTAAVLGLVAQPLETLDANQRLRRLEAESSSCGARRSLAVELADAEFQAKGLRFRLIGLALNLSAATAIYLISDDELAAGLQVGIGIVATEIQLLTLPTTFSDALEASGSRPEEGPTFSISPFGKGVAIELHF